ncbi:MAG: DNA replication/repair protein RecF [Pseudomonadales bacterium]
MAIRRLEVADLRNLASVSFDLDPHFNYFHGPNGSGKTALLEAIHLLARGRSFRGRQVSALIGHGADMLVVRAVLQAGRPVVVSKTRAGSTELRIDGEVCGRLSDAASMLPIQLILPTVGDLVFGSPGERRGFLDWGVFHVKHGYLMALREYLAILKQRNALLKAIAAGTGEANQLESWNDQFVAKAVAVSEYRQSYVDELTPHILDVLGTLEPELDIEIGYWRGWGVQSLDKVLGETLPNEVKFGASRSGPHRADLSLKIPGGNASATLSRGQGKILAIGLILAQARLLFETSGQHGIFLIDDIGAEIDRPHAARMLALLRDSGSQVIATSTMTPDHLESALDGGSIAVFHVEHGSVNQQTSL